jgi:5'(3')-deoxyribonucleotidase
MAAREQLNIDLDAEVAAILRSYAAEANVSEGEIVDRAIRAYDLRSLVARIRERSDLDEDQAMALVREELRAARDERSASA